MKRLIGLMAAVALATTGVLATPASAGVEACYDFDDTYEPIVNGVTANDAIVGWRGAEYVTVNVHMIDQAHYEDCDWDGAYDDLYASGVWVVYVESDIMTTSDGGYVGEYATEASLVSGTIYDGIWSATFEVDVDDSVGDYGITVDAMDNGANSTASSAGDYRVGKETFVETNAKPEPVRRGATIKVDGRVAIPVGMDFAYQRYQRLTFWFKRAGTHRWVYMGSKRTDSEGLARKRFEANRSGKWQVRFAGNAFYTSSQAADGVKVVR